MFDFLRSPAEGPRVMTGHASGLITINVEEADDAKREQIRHDLREPYRTLLGHFRHEVGHYYWDRLVWDTKWLEPFRQLFGDERASYAEALKRNYEQGPPADWANCRTSARTPPCTPGRTGPRPGPTTCTWSTASAPRWASASMREDLEGDIQPFTRDALYAPDDPNAERFLSLLNGWLEMTMVLNEMARSMGQPDFYPFVMSRPVVAKLQFVQMVVVRRAHEPGSVNLDDGRPWTSHATTVYLKDYTPPAFLISEVDLDIDLRREDDARVGAKLVVRRNPRGGRPQRPRLRSTSTRWPSSPWRSTAQSCRPDRYTLDDRHLTLPTCPIPSA